MFYKSFSLFVQQPVKAVEFLILGIASGFNAVQQVVVKISGAGFFQLGLEYLVPSLERIEKSAIKELLVLDTIELPEEKKIDKITMVSVADIFADAINCIHNGVSISQLFD